MSSSKDIAARSCSRSSSGRPRTRRPSPPAGGRARGRRFPRRPAIRSAATSSSVSIEEISDSRTASDTSSRISPSRVGVDQVPDVQPLVERQRLEDVGDVGRVQAVELARELRLVLAGRRGFDESCAAGAGTMLHLLVHQAFDQPVLAQQRRDFGERVLDAACASGRSSGLRGFADLGHGAVALKVGGGGRSAARILRADADGGHLERAARATRRAGASSRGERSARRAHGSSATASAPG